MFLFITDPCRHLVAGLALAASFFYVGCAVAAPVMGYQVVARYPHSTESYTEGFFYLDGLFYEGTGLEGHSALMAIQPETGNLFRLWSWRLGTSVRASSPGAQTSTMWTWKSHVCFVYDRFTFRMIKQLGYSGEGWGMTRTAKELITSDGTATLRFRDPQTFNETRHIVVHDDRRVVDQLNELEFIKG